MLTHPTTEKMYALRLLGMAKALEEQRGVSDIDAMSFEDRLGLLIDREVTDRESRRLTIRLRKAKLRQDACVEDIDFRADRGLDKGLVLSMAGCDWIKQHEHIIITGPTGVGKSFIACALAHKACLNGHTAYYTRISRLFADLAITKGDGQYSRIMAHIARTDVLVLDDWGLSPLTDEQRKDLLEIMEDRYQRRSLIITSQLPVDHWHEVIGNPTLADAILDRIIHNAHVIKMKGGSMRKVKNSVTKVSG